ncbi:MAG TPA: DUF485 domain-containing protein [Pyrinomonadaceae bacterium]|nr:DUF485 domain-containing protein [Pyrinomonadaceae bacterium]
MADDQESGSTVGDLTPEVGAATDVAPLGRADSKPAHELTAAEDSNPVDWSRVAQMPEFRSMVKAKLRFIIPAVVFFVVYYFALPVLVGYAPGLMSKKVFGVINIAYLFALSQFFMAWIIAALYLRAAAKFDKMEHRVIEKAFLSKEGND